MKFPLEKILPLFLIFIVATTGITLITRNQEAIKTPNLSLSALAHDFETFLRSLTPVIQIPNLSENLSTDDTTTVTDDIEPDAIDLNSTAKPLITVTPTTSMKITATPTRVITKKPTPTNNPCIRFKVTHPDGSSTNLCYTKSDYNALQKLNTSLLSAKTFYQFHLDGVTRYQELYKQTGSSIYLDAAASSQKQADEEAQKINEAQNAMYNLERLGY